MSQQTLVIIGIMAVFFVALFAEGRAGRRHLDAKWDARFVAMDAKIDSKIDGLRSDMDARFIEINTKFGEIDSKFDVVFAELRGVRQDMGFLAGKIGVELPVRTAS
ncbi:MAG TPA: hypothetical protein VMU77_06275 [Acidimicrobiales bacterium]|nr:hypothetical protein [Acidimicrobiales bacterium]